MYLAFDVLTFDENECYPGPSPLHPAAWQEKDGSLTFPSIQAELQGHERLLDSSAASPAVSLVWEEFLDRPPMVDRSSVQTMIDNVSVVASYQWPTMALVLALLAKPYHLPRASCGIWPQSLLRRHPC